MCEPTLREIIVFSDADLDLKQHSIIIGQKFLRPSTTVKSFT